MSGPLCVGVHLLSPWVVADDVPGTVVVHHAVVLEHLLQVGLDRAHGVLHHGHVDIQSVTEVQRAHMDGLSDTLSVEPAPEVHGGWSVLIFGDVVQVAVVQGRQNVVQLVVRGLPGLQPLLAVDHLQYCPVDLVQLAVLKLVQKSMEIQVGGVLPLI